MELLLAITVLSILTPVVLLSLGDLYRSNISTLNRSAQNTDTVSVLRSIQNELQSITGLDTALPVAIPLGPTNSTTTSETWSYCGINGTSDCAASANRVLIAYTNATDKAYTDKTRLPVFSNANGCNPANPTSIIQVAQIYFVAPDANKPSQNDLYRRTVVNPTGATTCNGTVPYQTNTCATSVLSNAGCKDSSGNTHSDAVLLTNIQSFNVDYYASASDSAAIDSEYSADPSTIKGAQTIIITVTTTALINGTSTPNTATIRISEQEN